LIHGTKINVKWRQYHGVPVTNSCTTVMTLAREDEGKWRGEMGVEEGADGSYIGALDVRGDGCGAVPREKRKEGRLEVGGGTDKGGPPVREKKRGRLPFRDGNRWAAEFGSGWLRSPKFLFSFFLLTFILFYFHISFVSFAI
jgi:hypothetical protein